MRIDSDCARAELERSEGQYNIGIAGNAEKASEFDCWQILSEVEIEFFLPFLVLWVAANFTLERADDVPEGFGRSPASLKGQLSFLTLLCSNKGLETMV